MLQPPEIPASHVLCRGMLSSMRPEKPSGSGSLVASQVWGHVEALCFGFLQGLCHGAGPGQQLGTGGSWLCLCP